MTRRSWDIFWDTMMFFWAVAALGVIGYWLFWFRR